MGERERGKALVRGRVPGREGWERDGRCEIVPAGARAHQMAGASARTGGYTSTQVWNGIMQDYTHLTWRPCETAPV